LVEEKNLKTLPAQRALPYTILKYENSRHVLSISVMVEKKP
jgi:hypothetical protein